MAEKHNGPHGNTVVWDPAKSERPATVAGALRKLIRVTYEIVTEESATEGDAAERGYTSNGVDLPIPDGLHGEAFGTWVDETVEPAFIAEQNPYDTDETPARMAAAWLRSNGYTAPSSYPPQVGDWYSWADAQQDMGDGSYRSESAHLEGFTDDEIREIQKLLK